MNLHMSWYKTRLQKTSYGTTPHAVVIQGHTVDVTDRFTYLGSDISSCGCSRPEMFRRIGLASCVMGQLTSVWQQSRLSLCSVHQAATVQCPCFRPTAWCRNLDPNKVWQTEAQVLPHVVLMMDSWNRLIRLCAKHVSNEPDSATKHPQQNPRQANLNIQSCTSSARISTSTWSTSSGCQHPCWSPTWWQTGVETSTRSSPTNLDPQVGDRRRARCRCCMGHGWWSQHLEGAMTYRRSCSPVSEWVS